MIKRVLIGLVIVGILAACVQAEPRTFVGLYWVRGTVTRGTGVGPGILLDGRTAILYVGGSDPVTGTYKVTTTVSNGAFALNPMLNRDIPLSYDAGFYSTAIMRGGDGYGADPVAVTIDEQGYKNISLTLLYGAGPGTAVISDTGWIRNTNIVKVGNDIRLTWDYDMTPGRGETDVNIYYAYGAGQEYPNRPDAFMPNLLGRVAARTKTRDHSGVAVLTDANNYYYRVVPASGAATEVLSPTGNSITVGMAKVPLLNDLYVFSGLPFQEDGISLDTMLGDQLGSGGEYTWWDGLEWKFASYTTSWSGSGSGKLLRIGEGFVMLAKGEGRKAVLTGRFGTIDPPPSITLQADKYNLIGYPYPTAKTLTAMGITPDAGAELYKWVQNTTTGAWYWGSMSYSGTAWTPSAGYDNLELSSGRAYMPNANFNWRISFP